MPKTPEGWSENIDLSNLTEDEAKIKLPSRFSIDAVGPVTDPPRFWTAVHLREIAAHVHLHAEKQKDRGSEF